MAQPKWNGISRACPFKRSKYEIDAQALDHREKKVKELIVDKEAQALRAMRAIILDGKTKAAADVTRLTAIEADIEEARAELAQIQTEREGLTVPAPGEKGVMAVRLV
jgi:hypothetical protein